MPEKLKINAVSDLEVDVSCQRCVGDTAHKILQSISVFDGDNNYDWNVDYEILQCLGCKSVSFRSVGTNSEEYYYEDEHTQVHMETVKIYPPRVAGLRGLGEESFILPEKLRGIYVETLQALVNNQPVLTGIGLRAILETLCKDHNAAGQNLYKQIDDLVTKNILTPRRAQILHQIRSLGNEAAHSVMPHSAEQLALAMSVVDHLLEEVYILPAKALRTFQSLNGGAALPPLTAPPAAALPQT